MINLNTRMTAVEKATKAEITKFLQEEGHKTYAAYFQEFDFHLLPKETDDVAFMRPNKWEIYLNSGITDLDTASVLLRHEMLHQFLKHGDRYDDIVRKHRNQKDGDPIVKDAEYHQNHNLANYAADWELSKYYSKTNDFPRIKHLKVNGQDAAGLVLELDHPEWLNLSFEEIYEKLMEDNEEMNALRKMLEQQIKQSSEAQQEAEAKAATGQRRMVVAKELAKEMRRQAKQKRKEAEQADKSGGASDTPDDAGEENGSGKSTTRDSKNQKNKSAADLKQEADDLEKAAELLEKAAETLADATDEQIEELEKQLPDFLKSDEDKEAEQKTREEMDKALKEGKLAQEVANEIKQEQLAKEREKAQREEQLKQMKSEQEKLADMRNNLKWCRTMDQFVLDLNTAIKKQVEPEGKPYDSYTKTNRRFMGMHGAIRPGQRFDVPKKNVPVINVYYDRSGSWGPEWKTAAGNAALKTLDQKYVKTGKIKINLFYEANGEIYDHYIKAGGGGMDSNVVLDDIEKRKPDNVIIMTDSDADYCANCSPITVPGNVWYIFAESAAPNLVQTLRGRKGTYCYDASSGTSIQKVGEKLEKQPKKKLKLKWRE